MYCSVPSNFYPIHRVNLKDEENIDCKTMFSVKNGKVNKVFSAQCLGLVHFAYFFFLVKEIDSKKRRNRGNELLSRWWKKNHTDKHSKQY